MNFPKGTYKTFLVSIPSTGTVFLQNLIKPDGFKHAHSHMARDKMLGANHIVAPLRHPVKVWRTFAKKPENPVVFWEAFKNMNELAKEFRITFIPVDIPGVREERLRQFGDLVGQKYEANWSAPMNVTPESDRDVPEVDLSPLWNYGFVQQHYPEPEQYEGPLMLSHLEPRYFPQHG